VDEAGRGWGARPEKHAPVDGVDAVMAEAGLTPGALCIAKAK